MPAGQMISIGNHNYRQFIDPHVDGEQKKCGTLPRNFQSHPVGYLMHAKPFDVPLIPESEWDAEFAKYKAEGRQLSKIRDIGNAGSPIPSRDQNGKGYCWFHSGTSAALIARAMMNEPYADLSAYMGACIIKDYQDEGGWGSEGVEFAATNGYTISKYWPQQSMSRSNDTPEMRADAKKRRWQDWRDFDPAKMKAQVITWLLRGHGPLVTDFNWWGHSVCTMDLVSIRPFKTLIWNSWGDSWSANGAGELEEDKAIPDSCLGMWVATASQN